MAKVPVVARARKPEAEDLDDLDAVDVSADALALDQRLTQQKADADADKDDEDEWEEGDEDDLDDDADEDDSGAADEDEDEESDLKAEKPKEKKKQTAKERIAELARLRRAAEKAAFEAELRAQDLERQLNEKPAAKAADLPAKPQAKDFVYGEVDPGYQDALVEYRVAEQMATQRAQFEASKTTETEATVAARYQARLAEVMEKGAKRHKDFEESVNGTKFDSHLARLVLDSDNAVDIAYFLSNNVSELRKATFATPEERARIIGRLEGRFSASSAARKQRTGAPEPIGRDKAGRRKRVEDTQYGPSSQDDFDKAFWSN